MKILSTKILDDSIADTLPDIGHALVCVDFITIADIDIDIAALNQLIYDAVVFTSSNGLKSFFTNDKIKAAEWTKPIYALSGKTKDELAVHGLVAAGIADNSSQLAELIISNESIRSILHPCGNLTPDAMQNELMAAGLSYSPLIVYENTPQRHVLHEPYDAVMLYSPSGVESYTMDNAIDHETLYCCIGETTAAALKNINDKIDIILPKQPTPGAMLRAILDFKERSKYI